MQQRPQHNYWILRFTDWLSRVSQWFKDAGKVLLGILITIFLFFTPMAIDGFSAQGTCGEWLCPDDTFSKSGHDLDGYNWSAIEQELISPYLPPHPSGWNITQNFDVSGDTLMWLPWAEADNDMDVDNLKDTYVSGTATWTKNTAVTDETSEWFMATARNLTYTQVDQFINYLDNCKSTYDDALTAWICSRDGTTININDPNSASDATARIAIGFYMCALDPDHTSGERSTCLTRANDITDAAIAEEFITSCRDSLVNDTEQLCEWRLAGAAQAWGPGALTQVGQQMFIGYHESNIMHLLAAYAATGNTTYKEYARHEAHQFLYVMQYDWDDAPGTFTMPVEDKNYYMDCTTEPCIPDSAYDGGGFEDADAPRAWETCNNVEYARLVFEEMFSEAIPWEFQALEGYCDAWATKVVNGGTASGTQLVDADNGCYQISDTATCKVAANSDSYRNNAWPANMVAYKEDAAYFESFMEGPLTWYETTPKYYAGGGGDPSPTIRGYGIYGQVRNIRVIRAAIGDYDHLFLNQSYGNASSAANDTTAPIITNIVAVPQTTNATITWTTDENSNSSVDWGQTTSLGSSTGSSSNTKSHSITLTSLSSGQLYYYNVTSCDNSGNCNTSGPNSFTTNAQGASNNASFTFFTTETGCFYANGTAATCGTQNKFNCELPYYEDYEPWDDEAGTYTSATPTGTAYWNESGYLDIPNATTGAVELVPTTVTIENNWTVSFWAYLYDSNRHSIIGDAQGTLGYIFLRPGTRDIIFEPSSVNSHGAGLGNIMEYSDTNKWIHWVLVSNGTHMLGYRNNTFVESDAFTNGIDDLTMTRIGRGYTGVGGSYLEGRLDELQVWNRSLNTTEIDLVYQNQSVTGDLVMHFKFDNQSATMGCLNV